MNLPTKAVILARVSSKGQETEGYSLDSQVKTMQAYCDSRGLAVAKTFKIAETASKSKQRHIFKEAMKFIEDNKIKDLIVEKVDRHVRNLQDAVETHDWLLADENKKVHFVKDSLVLHKNSRSQEWLNWGVRVVMSKNYVDNLREESMKGIAEKLEQGWLPSPPPPGYITVTENGKRIHVPEPRISKLMVKVFQHYLKPGSSIETTRQYMTELGIVTKAGRSFVKSRVHNILKDPFYTGTNRFNGKDYPGVQETFIPKPLFKRVQEKLHGGRPHAYVKHHSSLQGIISCEDCGSVVTWQLQKGRYYGVCRRLTEACKQSKMLREDKVEEMILVELQRLVCPAPEIVDWVANAMRNHYKSQIDERERLVSTIQGQLKRIDAMNDTLYDDKLAGDITKERYEEKHQQFMTQKKELEAQLLNMDESMAERLEQRLVILELSQKAAEIYPKKTPEQKRLIISKLFSNLTLKGGSLSVKYSKFSEAIAEKVQITHKLMEG